MNSIMQLLERRTNAITLDALTVARVAEWV
jgi:hypothetical protein